MNKVGGGARMYFDFLFFAASFVFTTEQASQSASLPDSYYDIQVI